MNILFVARIWPTAPYLTNRTNRRAVLQVETQHMGKRDLICFLEFRSYNIDFTIIGSIPPIISRWL
jgi:hypothetical protein